LSWMRAGEHPARGSVPDEQRGRTRRRRALADTITTNNGRRLSVQAFGDPDGIPVFLLHGTPGSRLGPRPRGPVLHRLGVRLIAFDRPGYGRSDRLAGRRVADVAADVAAIADAFRLDRFAVVGRSGGGPHALACAALLPDRASRVAVLVGLAPRGADGLDWFDGMASSNVIDFTAAVAGHEPLSARLLPAAESIREDPARLIASLQTELPEPDRRVVADSGIRSMLLSTYEEALRSSAYGWIDDVMAFCAPWGFDPATIAVPVLIWHGESDVFSPVGHAHWLAERIPSATVVIQAGAAHFGALDVMPDILRWLAAKSKDHARPRSVAAPGRG
jgi:pimeloyl-ACP methyl ester carboxylesterase